MSRHIVVHTFAAPNGVGDIIYFFNWYKMYHKHINQQINKILMVVADVAVLKKVILDILDAEPQHPAFSLIKIENRQLEHHQDCIIDTLDNAINNNIFFVKNSKLLSIRHYFNDISENDYVTVICASCSPFFVVKNIEYPQIITKLDNFILLLEFCRRSIHIPNTALGIAPGDLGILTDINGITGNENISELLSGLKPEFKELIFNNKYIYSGQAINFLATTPSVFCYIQKEIDLFILHAIYKSPLIQEAIAQGNTPLFFLTNGKTNNLPISIQIAMQNRQIKVVAPGWICAKQYRLISGLFLNRQTQSIIVPSGDNSLSLCIKAGKLPIYAHKIYNTNKYLFFQDLLNFFLIPQQYTQPGAKNCTAIFEHLSHEVQENICISWPREWLTTPLHQLLFSRFELITKDAAYTDLGSNITIEALNFFSDYVAPNIMAQCNFEQKTMPGIVNKFKQHTPALPKTKIL